MSRCLCRMRDILCQHCVDRIHPLDHNFEMNAVRPTLELARESANADAALRSVFGNVASAVRYGLGLGIVGPAASTAGKVFFVA